MKGCGITHITNKTLLEIQRHSGKTILLLLLWKLDDIWQLIGRGLDSSSCQILINDLLDNVSHPPHDKLAKHRTAFKEFFHPTHDRVPQEVIPACGHQMLQLFFTYFIKCFYYSSHIYF